MENRTEAVILTFHPDRRLFELLERLEKQSFPVHRIHILNTEEEKLLPLFGTKEKLELFLRQHPQLELTHLTRDEFDHGRTRDMGMRLAREGKYVLFMTQDAIPADTELVRHLVEALQRETLGAVAYARQLPAENATEAEKFSRCFNYPSESRVKTAADIRNLGIKTYFCSDVCAMYRRDLYEEIGGFPFPVIFNEDMIYAAGAVEKGYCILYEAEAEVIHSHNYTALQQLSRNFDLGVSQADHPEVFSGISSEGEGKKYVLEALKWMWKRKGYSEVLPFLWGCGFRLLGYRLGKNYRKLPEGMIRRLTMDKGYWSRRKHYGNEGC